MSRHICFLFYLALLLLSGCRRLPLPPAGPWTLSKTACSETAEPAGHLSVPLETPVYRTFPLRVQVPNLNLDSDETASWQVILPAGLAVVHPPFAAASSTDHVDLPGLPPMSAGQQASLVLLVKADAPGKYDIDLQGTVGQRRLPAITRTVTITRANLELTVIPPDQPCPETVTAWQFQIRNTGTAPAPASLLSWDVPSGLRFVSAVRGNYASGRVSWNLGNIFPGEVKPQVCMSPPGNRLP